MTRSRRDREAVQWATLTDKAPYLLALGLLASMLALDDRDAPYFSDVDYRLAAYAAAPRVLTR